MYGENMDNMHFSTESIKTVRQILGECTVLLRSSGAFPLKTPCKIALFGSGARQTVMGGTGSGEVNSGYIVTCEEGLLKAGFEISTGEWLDAYDSVRMEAKREFVKQIKREARKERKLAVMYAMGKVMPEPEYDIGIEGEGDVALYVLSRISGEGSDRRFIKGDFLLTDTEKRDILALAKKYKRFMLVLNVGGPVDLSELDEVSDILYLSELGSETGNALADVLLGVTYPSGKLSTTFAEYRDYPSLGSFGERDDAKYKEGVYVGYRYFDSVGKRPLFPFGFGTSYTEFLIKPLEVKENDGVITVSAAVLNRGSYRGKEVVQVYLCPPRGNIDKPYQSLVAFKKTRELAPSESDMIEMIFDMRDHASFYVDRGEWVLDAGVYTVRVGNSSEATVVAAAIEIPHDITVKSVASRPENAPTDDFVPERKIYESTPEAKIRIEELTERAPQAKETLPRLADGLCKEDIALICVGNFGRVFGALSVIGNASTRVPGAAGETTSRLGSRAGEPLVLADGPAGVRISPTVYEDEKGLHGVGDGGLPETMKDYLAAPLRKILELLSGKKSPKGKKLLYRYATSLPIGTALANSFNTELAETLGGIVGEDMERFGVDIWLAPALNIHRDVRCGRNFEYYSEDPLLSGLMAGYIARGVESHSGRGVCYKHFAVNNQETNRYNNNSIVSERALREIYLKSFEIAIRTHKPTSVMTSYNLLNGIHTSMHEWLIGGYLRGELEYDGLVMTDWLVGFAMNDKRSPYKPPESSENLAAGTDLMMPGGKRDFKRILKALKKGEVDMEAARESASRILSLTLRKADERRAEAPDEKETALV